MNRRASILIVAATALCAACASDLRDPTASEALAPAMPVTHRDDGEGVTRTVIDAREAERWVYLDLESRAQVMPAAPDDSREWDLGFQRFRIKLNGGASGSGNMQLARVEGASLADVRAPPDSGYVTDQADGPDENSEPDLAFSSGDLAWYAYDSADHTLAARDVVYVLRSVEGEAYKLQLVQYYDRAGTGGYPEFRWSQLTPEP